jgi:pilus assembly protein Flp/PilA
MCIRIKSYFENLKGATAIEYGLIAAGIAMAISVSVFLFGDAIKALLYDDLPKAIQKP